MIIPTPIALILAGALYWQATLGTAAVLGLVGFLADRGWFRAICYGLAALLAADCLLAVLLLG